MKTEPAIISDKFRLDVRFVSMACIVDIASGINQTV